MTCTRHQKTRLLKFIQQSDLTVAATKAGMSVNTARKYLKTKGEHPGTEERRGRPKNSALDNVWSEVSELLACSPGLEAKTVLCWLIDRDPIGFNWSQLRTLQRRFKDWRLSEGPDKEVYFPQTKHPGRQSQSDYTCMHSLQITIDNSPFPHLLFHFMLPYSRWETVSICHSESFDSLSEGFENAVWELGGVAKEHRTDNLSAATHWQEGTRVFNANWSEIMMHYGVKPSRNNPGRSNENGSVEKSHDLYKKAVEQQLLMRGSRNFSTLSDYNDFLLLLTSSRNAVRKELLTEEMKYLRPLPEWRWEAPKLILPRVTPMSTIQIFSGTYSVPSRLIGSDVKAYVYPKNIDIYYGNKKIMTMPRLQEDKGELINYRHIVKMLLRKPGAFENYMYREALFPRLIFRHCLDVLIEKQPARAYKCYLEILHLAAIGSEEEVATALELLLEERKTPTLEALKSLIDLPCHEMPTVEVTAPNITQYDELIHSHKEGHRNATVH